MPNPPNTEETRPPRSEPQTNTEHEWPDAPLPPRELDPNGEGDALRSHAHPGDDTVFAANAEPKEAKQRKNAPAPAGEKEPRTTNDAERSRTER